MPAVTDTPSRPPRALGDFTGTPLVGEIVGLRTFRVDDSGLLLPLYSNEAWYDGANTAACAPPTGHHHSGPHAAPAEHCECGFYAYGSVAAAGRNRHMRYVQAVVSCWGTVIGGTQGVRAEHARVDALWISPQAPGWLRRRVAQRYPSARIFGDAGAMLAEYPLSRLDCYDEPRARHPAGQVAGWLGLAALLSLGLLPLPLLQSHHPLWLLWLAVTALAGAGTGWLLVGTRSAGHYAAAFVMAGVTAWLAAPALGLGGWLLRVPLLRGLAVGVGGYLLALRPHYFPVLKSARERPFCGVRV